MTNKLLNVLLIEDNLAEARLLREFLLTNNSTEFKINHVDTLKQALEQIKTFSPHFDVILLDLTLPDSNGLDSLPIIMKEVSTIPIIILTNNNDEELAINAVSIGAQDYLVKRMINPELLFRSLNYAIERKSNQEAIIQTNQELIKLNELLRQEITERRQIQEKLAHKNEELEQFAYIVSHDLKQPLTTISGWTQMLQCKFNSMSNPDAEIEKYFNYILNSVQDMAKLIDVLLEYATIETNSEQFQLNNCNQTLEQTKQRLQRVIALHNAEITSDSLPTIKADPVLLVELFQNLIDNAIKYRSEKPPKIHISAKLTQELDEKKWLFSFKDNGIGITPEYQKKVFLVFKRFKKNTNQSGSGIGLAICEKVVKYHGGKIWVESTEGEGSTFYFTINEIES